MSEYVWRTSSKGFRSYRNASLDDSGAYYCDLIIPTFSSNEHYRRERKKFRSYIGSIESIWHSDGEDDNTSRIVMQQASQRKDIAREKKMKVFSRLFKILLPHEKSAKAIEESESNLEGINSKLDQMIATLDGENDWFVECHPVLEDNKKDESV